MSVSTQSQNLFILSFIVVFMHLLPAVQTTSQSYTLVRHGHWVANNIQLSRDQMLNLLWMILLDDGFNTIHYNEPTSILSICMSGNWEYIYGL